MSQSFDLLIDGMIEAIRSRILPQLSDDFVRGQAYGIIYALNGLKLSADWATAPLQSQIELQDKAFADVIRLGAGLNHWYHMDMAYRGIINMLVFWGD